MKLRKELLLDLLRINSVSGEEQLMYPILTKELYELGFDVSLDDVGNIYAVRGKAEKYPLLNAHMDIVEIDYFSKLWNKGSVYTSYDLVGYDDRNYDKYDEIFNHMPIEDKQLYLTCNDCIRRFDCKNIDKYKTTCHSMVLSSLAYDKIQEYCFDIGLEFDETVSDKVENVQEIPFIITESKGKIEGDGSRVLGGDDKCGIFIALELARILRNQPMKILFTISEEIGCVGIEHFVKTNAEWFKDVAYDITIDRRYGDNLLWQQCGKYSCSKEFASELASIGIQQGIPVKLENGTVADVIYIREFVKESVNISAGYYEPHSEEEYIIYDDVIRITKWLATFIKKYQPKKTVKLLTELTK